MTTSLTITSYNILHPYFAIGMQQAEGFTLSPNGRRMSNWQERGIGVVKNLQTTGFDIACLQEVSPGTLRTLTKQFNLFGYAQHWQHPTRKHPGFNYGNALLWRGEQVQPNQRFQIEGHTRSARRAAAGLFTIPASGHKLLVISAHLWGYPPVELDPETMARSKQQGYRELRRYLTVAELYKPEVDAIVLAGDFNEHTSEDGKPYSRHDLLCEYDYRSDGNPIPSEPATGRRIDRIYVWSRNPAQLTPLNMPVPHPGASDHLPVSVRVGLG